MHHHHHHHQVMLIAHIPLTLSHNPSLLTIILSKSSRLHPGATQLMYISLYGFANSGVSKCRNLKKNVAYGFVFTSLAVHLIWMACKIRGRWSYCRCFEGVASRIYSKQHGAFLSSSHLVLQVFCWSPSGATIQ